jgi:hypothetical protein
VDIRLIKLSQLKDYPTRCAINLPYASTRYALLRAFLVFSRISKLVIERSPDGFDFQSKSPLSYIVRGDSTTDAAEDTAVSAVKIVN